MGVRILVGREQGCENEQAVLFCSTTGWAFGPLFESETEAEEFLEWYRDDPRMLTDEELADRVCEFRKASRGEKS